MTSRSATVYIGLVIAAGATALGHGLWHWHTEDLSRYLFYLAIALLASRMKVSLQAVSGTMSMNFLFVLIGVADLSRAETLAMGCLGMLVQCVFYTKTKPRVIQVLFSVASMACSIEVSYWVYHVRFLGTQALEAPLLLLLAAGAFFVTNTCSVALVIALTEGKHPWSVWRQSYLWSFPNYLVGAAVAWTISAASRYLGWQTSLLLFPILYVIYRSHRLYVDRLEEEKRHAEEQRNHAEELAALQRRTIMTLALAIEAKDQTTHDHLERVEIYAVEVGKELGLSKTELQALQAAALLHDIGKLAVPEHIISKPGKLTPEEFEKMKIHPIVGAELVEQVRFPYPVAPIVRAHHEKWDGSGYPDGLSGEEIPIGARILAAVDCLDALASDRQYRRALPLDDAIKVVEELSGKAFDPRVVEVLARRYVELEQKASSRTQSERMKLSTDVKVERGAAPDAGFENRHDNTSLSNLNNSLAETARQASALIAWENKFEQCETRASLWQALQEALRELVPSDAKVVYIRHGEVLKPESLDGEDYRLFASLEIPLGMGLSGWVAENGKAIINGNPSVEPGYLQDPTKFSLLRSALAVPLEIDGSVNGVLSLYRQGREAFRAEDLTLVTAIGKRFARCLKNTAETASSVR